MLDFGFGIWDLRCWFCFLMFVVGFVLGLVLGFCLWIWDFDLDVDVCFWLWDLNFVFEFGVLPWDCDSGFGKMIWDFVFLLFDFGCLVLSLNLGYVLGL